MSELDVIRVLLVEDNEHDGIAFTRALKKSGAPYEVTTCRRVEEAVETLSAAPALLRVSRLFRPPPLFITPYTNN